MKRNRQLLLAAMPCLANAFLAPQAAMRRAYGATPATVAARDAFGSKNGSYASTSGGFPGATATVLAALGCGLAASARKATKQRRAASQRHCFFGSSGSGFLGLPSEAAFGVTAEVQETGSQNGAAGLNMRHQTWWLLNTGFDGRKGKIFDSRRRESRRRGEELFRHNPDNFELTLHNLVRAPGARKFKIRRGRGKYGHHGRTCGYGQMGAKSRGRGTVPIWYEAGNVPLQKRIPKLSQEQMASMRPDPYTPITLAVLNCCDDGDEVDYMDLYIRGLPIKKTSKRDIYKVKGTEEDEFTVKNLTVYAHLFEPAAREKIELNGGRCIRLDETTNLPAGGDAVRVPVSAAGEEEEPESQEAAEE